MRPSRSIYDSPRLAAQYAFDRPPVHAHILRAIGARLHLDAPVARALDIGCGAGLSTAARALAPGGVLVIYDFSAGRRLRGI